MSIDTPAMKLDWRGIVTADDELLRRVAALAVQFPVGCRIESIRSGREGTVRADEPVHVPGYFDGDPTAVCLSRIGTPMVFAHWDNEEGITWGVWVPADTVHRVPSRAVNRPSNRAQTGARR
ncbi:hypothetical protein ACFY1J_31185 [Streptomyces sp. NPDC001406]|uniref:hypothetical protein n=1 Tax=Streptomyces sp. NPDC001406 TaxID=3364572 RepID=UPI003677FA6A